MSRTYEIRDPVHGFISLDEWEWEILNQPAFQRLRRIKQLAWTDYIYPGAAHSRFEHSLGAMHVAARLFQSICDRNADLLKSEFSLNADGIGRQIKIIRLAALLHDIGHAPFSHAAEAVFPLESESGLHFAHETYSSAIVDYALRDVIENHALNQNNYRITADEIKSVFSERPGAGKNLVWKLLVSGQMDADRMDYLLRDSLHAGVSYGRYDLDRIAATITLCEEPETGDFVIGVEEGGARAVEGLLIARYMMFTQVYFHKTRTVYDYHLIEALKEMLKSQGGVFPRPDSEKNIQRYLDWDDWKVLGAIKAKQAGEHGERLLSRTHYRPVYATPEVPDSDDLEKFEYIFADLADLGAIQREAGRSWYRFEKEGIWVKPDAANATPRELSTISPVVKGLQTIKQHRIYVPPQNRAAANARIEKYLNA
jgi:HD superfamily phosphohydrolase